MNIEQERAAFEAWLRVKPCGAAHDFGWKAWQARAALQSQPRRPEISCDLLGKIVDEVFDGAIEDAGVIEDIYRVIARETALQSQDQEDAERYRWLRARWGRIADEYDGDSDQLVAIREADSHFEGWDVDPVSLDRAIDAAMQRTTAAGSPLREGEQ